MVLSQKITMTIWSFCHYKMYEHEIRKCDACMNEWRLRSHFKDHLAEFCDRESKLYCRRKRQNSHLPCNNFHLAMALINWLASSHGIKNEARNSECVNTMEDSLICCLLSVQHPSRFCGSWLHLGSDCLRSLLRVSQGSIQHKEKAKFSLALRNG